MKKFSNELLSVLDRIHTLFNYPKEEKRIPEKVIWSNDIEPTPKDFIDDFDIPKKIKSKLIKLEVIQGKDDVQQLSACLYALKDDKTIVDHHYYSDDFGHYFIIAAPDDFPKIYKQIKKYGGRRNSIKKIYIFYGNDGIYRIIVIGEEGARMAANTAAEWAKALYDVAQNGQIPHNKSRANVNSAVGLAIYCKGFFTKTRFVGETTNQGNAKYLVPGDVKIKIVSNKEEFHALKQKYRL